jgi:hypothetical protein
MGEQRPIREAMAALQGYGISTSLAGRIYKTNLKSAASLPILMPVALASCTVAAGAPGRVPAASASGRGSPAGTARTNCLADTSRGRATQGTSDRFRVRTASRACPNHFAHPAGT